MKPSGSGGKAKEGDSMSAHERVVGEGPGVLIEGNNEGIRRHDFEGGRGGGGGGGGGRRIYVGKSNI